MLFGRYKMVGAGIIGTAFMGALFSWGILEQWNAHVILSPSMEPELSVGSVVLVRPVLPSHYRPHDVVTFFIPGKGGERVTHRIVTIRPPHEGEAARVFTKGDANSNGDSWILSLGNIQGKVILEIPYLGYLLHAIQNPYNFLVLMTVIFLGLVVPFVSRQLSPRHLKIPT